MTYRTAALDALGNGTCRSVFGRLGRGGSCAVGEPARELPVSRPAVSQHLKVLQQAGLVTHDAVETRRIYRLDPAGLEGQRTCFEQFWTEALASFKEVAERLEEQHDNKEKQ